MDHVSHPNDGDPMVSLPGLDDASLNGSFLNDPSVLPPTSNALPSLQTSFFDNPPRLAAVRQRLFEVQEQIELSAADFQRYWPYVDNVWVRQRTTTSNRGQTTTEYYMCRLKRPTTKAKEKAPAPDGKKSRKKMTREGGTCQMQLKVVRFEGAYSSCTITRMAGQDETLSHTHTHDLEYIDSIKRNTVVMNTARQEAIKGYLPSSVYAKLQEEREALEEAGGKYLTVTDIRNAQHSWRVENPDIELRAHDGYEYQQGHGIVKVGNDNSLIDTDLGSDFQLDAALASLSSEPSPAPMTAPAPPSRVLHFSEDQAAFLQSYLPALESNSPLPHVTLTYATSLDSMISLAPGVQTALSGPETKAMTHYLRSKHDAILVGVGTVLADDPGLNCRLEGAGGYGGLGWDWQPRPIIIDPLARWPIHPETRLLKTVAEGKGKAPWIVISPGAYIDPATHVMLKSYGGDYLKIMDYNQNWRLRWSGILQALHSAGIRSVMIEGGGGVISELLDCDHSDLIDSLVITIAPTYLGKGGVMVSPAPAKDENGVPKQVVRPREVRWQPMGEDVIMCGKIKVPMREEDMEDMVSDIDLIAAGVQSAGDGSAGV